MATIPVWQYSKMIVSQYLTGMTKWIILIVAIILLYCVWRGTFVPKTVATIIIICVVIGALQANISSNIVRAE
jgi:hypothetical protein